MISTTYKLIVQHPLPVEYWLPTLPSQVWQTTVYLQRHKFTLPWCGSCSNVFVCRTDCCSQLVDSLRFVEMIPTHH